MEALRSGPEPDSAAVAALQRRMRLWGSFVLLLLIAIVAAMVFKPTL